MVSRKAAVRHGDCSEDEGATGFGYVGERKGLMEASLTGHGAKSEPHSLEYVVSSSKVIPAVVLTCGKFEEDQDDKCDQKTTVSVMMTIANIV